MKRYWQAAALPFVVALAIALPGCDDDPAPTDPGDDNTPALTVATCIDCHSDEDALKATAAPVTEVAVVAAGDG
jgi:hypothetical protein